MRLKSISVLLRSFHERITCFFFFFGSSLGAEIADSVRIAHEKAPNELFHCDDICVWEEYLATCMRTFDKFSRLYNSNTRVGCSKANSIFMRWIVIFLAFKCVK